MSLADVATIVTLIALIVYVLFGGADFGGGIWAGLASGPRANRQRSALFHAIGPVWETNHVWLILVVVTLFTVFPPAFADLFVALMVPLVITAISIIFRGTALAFRHFGQETGEPLPAINVIFSASSLIAPLVMGMIVGAVAGGHITIENGEVTSGLFGPWLRPFPIMCGLIAVVTCAVLAAFYMTIRTTGAIQEDFRNRGLVASLVLGVLTTIAIPVAYFGSEVFWDSLTESASLALMIVAVLMGLATLVVLWRRMYLLAPPVAAGTVVFVMSAWGTAQYPYLILPGQRISDVAAESGTIALFLILLAIGATLLVPSLYLLYRVFSEKTDTVAA